jgi:hypothetical protein
MTKSLKPLTFVPLPLYGAFWKFRNEISCFKRTRWTGGAELPRKIANMLQDWRLLTKEEVTEQLTVWARELERRSMMPPQLTWTEQSHQGPGHGSDGPGNSVLNAENNVIDLDGSSI